MKNNHLKIIIAFILFSFVFIDCCSQRQFLLGAKAGIDIPNLSGGSGGSNPVSRGWSSRLGPYFGLVGIYKLTNGFALQAEINYSAQGGKKNGKQAIPTSALTSNPPAGSPEYIYANINIETKLNYIEVPVMAKLSFAINNKWHFFINAGPYLGYLVAAKNTAKGTTNVYSDEAEQMPLLPQPITIDDEQDVKNEIKKFNAGVQGGIGMLFKAPLGNIMLSAGGNYGFIPIQKDSRNGKNNTGAANITLGYLFTL